MRWGWGGGGGGRGRKEGRGEEEIFHLEKLGDHIVEIVPERFMWPCFCVIMNPLITFISLKNVITVNFKISDCLMISSKIMCADIFASNHTSLGYLSRINELCTCI